MIFAVWGRGRLSSSIPPPVPAPKRVKMEVKREIKREPMTKEEEKTQVIDLTHLKTEIQQMKAAHENGMSEMKTMLQKLLARQS